MEARLDQLVVQEILIWAFKMATYLNIEDFNNAKEEPKKSEFSKFLGAALSKAETTFNQQWNVLFGTNVKI